MAQNPIPSSCKQPECMEGWRKTSLEKVNMTWDDTMQLDPKTRDSSGGCNLNRLLPTDVLIASICRNCSCRGNTQTLLLPVLDASFPISSKSLSKSHLSSFPGAQAVPHYCKLNFLFTSLSLGWPVPKVIE